MSNYALKISHYLVDKDLAIEYFIPFTKKALVGLLDGDLGDIIGEIFSLDKEELKGLLEKSEGTLNTFLGRHNLYDLKDENGENYFVELPDKDNQGDVWIINNPEEPEENSLGDYLADAKLVSDTVDTVGFLEFERYIEGSKSVSDINEEAEDTLMFRIQFFLEKVIFSIIVAIDESDDWTTFEWTMPPKDFCDYINSFFPDIKNNSDGENVVQSLDEIFELVENSFSEKIVDIEQFTESFLRLEVPDISYSLYAASYDYIYKVFEILTDNREDLRTDELVEYIDKIHINLWEVSKHKPFWFIRLLKLRIDKYNITKDLLSANWNYLFIGYLPKGIKIFENIKKIFEGPIKWCINREKKKYKRIIEKYDIKRSGCYVIALTEDKDYIALSGLDYDGNILNGEPLKSDTDKYNKIMSIVEENILVRDAIHCNLNDLTKRYTKIIFKEQEDSKNCNKKNPIEYDVHYAYLKDDLKIKFKEKIENYGLTFGCCERKILGKVLPEGLESIKQKIVFFSRWAPCEKCRPAIFALENNCYYAYADKYEKGVKYNLSKYYVNENPNETNEKKYEIIKEELKKDIDSSSKVQPQENDCAADNNVQLQESDADIKIYDDQYRIFNLYMSDYKGEEFELGYSIQIKSYLLEPKYRYIQIGINVNEEISIFCDKKKGKAYIGLKYAFLNKLKIKNVYEGDVYYWGEKSVQDFMKKELSGYCSKEWDDKVFGNMVEIDFAKIKATYILPTYGKPIILFLRQNLEINKGDRISNIVFNSSVEDIDISMCKYGMKSLSEVKQIYFCCCGNKDYIVKLIKVCKKVIEACKVDKLLKKIEEEKQPGSKIKEEKKKLRGSIKKMIKKTIKNKKGYRGVFEDKTIHFEDITVYIIK